MKHLEIALQNLHLFEEGDYLIPLHHHYFILVGFLGVGSGSDELERHYLLEGCVGYDIAVPADHLEGLLREESVLSVALEFQASRPVEYSSLRGDEIDAIEWENIMEVIDIRYNLIYNIPAIDNTDFVLSRN